MIQLSITETAKGYPPKVEWYRYDNEIVAFSNIGKAKEYLKKRYGKCKRKKMFTGNGEHIGYIYCFWASDDSHHPIKKWIQHDRVEFREMRSTFAKYYSPNTKG